MASADELGRAFAAAWGSAPGETLPPGTAERLAELCANAMLAHPTLRIDPCALAAAIAARAPASTDDLAAYLGRCRAAELAVAQAAAMGSGAAITEIERAHKATIDSACRKFAGPGHSADDLRQILRTRLFVAEAGAQPKIADFAGQGFLENWLRVTAVRIFIDLGKRKDRAREAPAAEDDVLALPEPGDLALDVIKAEYRGAVAAAMHEAAQALDPGDRHLLRQHLVAGLSIDQLGAVLGIHRATAARRIARAKEQLAADTRRLVADKLALSSAELDDVLGLVISRLDVSIAKLLATGVAPR